MSRHIYSVTLAASVLFLALGCASKKGTPPPSGFISDYSKLKPKDGGAMRYVSPAMRNYTTFMIDPVEMRAKKSLTPSESAEVAKYFNTTLANEFSKRGYKVVNQPDVGVARIRIAMTDIKQSTWWMNVHPASKLSGAGTGGASMEGEVIDSVTGEQLGAVIQTGKGNQFELDTFSKLDDVKDAINGWAKAAVDRLDQLRAGA